MLCCVVAVSVSYVNEKCYKKCDNCQQGYEARKLLGGSYLKEVIEFCRNALNFCESVGEDCWQAKKILEENNEL
ncbi:MAG: hypothetical protein LBT18_04670 [Endomicrobium sp.]|nr:hypothetical protein [Endomicrobium sp.]